MWRVFCERFAFIFDKNLLSQPQIWRQSLFYSSCFFFIFLSAVAGSLWKCMSVCLCEFVSCHQQQGYYYVVIITAAADAFAVFLLLLVAINLTDWLTEWMKWVSEWMKEWEYEWMTEWLTGLMLLINLNFLTLHGVLVKLRH